MKYIFIFVALAASLSSFFATEELLQVRLEMMSLSLGVVYLILECRDDILAELKRR